MNDSDVAFYFWLGVSYLIFLVVVEFVVNYSQGRELRVPQIKQIKWGV